jgi:uncharacterized membrane protein
MKAMLKNGTQLFLQGLLALLPIILSFYAVVWLFTVVMKLAANFLVFFPSDIRMIWFVEWTVQILVIGFITALLIAFGLLVRTIIGKNMLRIADKIIGAIPIVKVLYNTSKQVIELFSLRKTTANMRPVLVEYPSQGIWVVGFHTGPAGEELSPNSEEHFTVFIPTTPNPTSGFLCVMPVSKIRPLEISMEQAVKLILTAGAVKK